MCTVCVTLPVHYVCFFMSQIRHPVPAPGSHRLVGLNCNKAQTLSPATNSCCHFPPSTTLSPVCSISCQVTPVIRYFLPDLEEQGNDHLCDCLSLNSTNNLPSSDSPPLPSPLSSPPNPDCSFHRLGGTVPVCLCLRPQVVSACS